MEDVAYDNEKKKSAIRTTTTTTTTTTRKIRKGISMNRIEHRSSQHEKQEEEEDLLGIGLDPVRTDSGLLLTHRKAPITASTTTSKGKGSKEGYVTGLETLLLSEETKPTDHRRSNNFAFWQSARKPSPPLTSTYHQQQQQMQQQQQRHLLACVRRITCALLILLVLGTASAATMALSASSSAAASKKNSEAPQQTTNADGAEEAMEAEEDSRRLGLKFHKPPKLPPPQQHQQHINTTQFHNDNNNDEGDGDDRGHQPARMLRKLKDEFTDWINHHNKNYQSQEEHDHRFLIWAENHHIIAKKNERHGPCRKTGKPVFGSNQFKDLTTIEFNSRYLTGYNGPTEEHFNRNKALRIDELYQTFKQQGKTFHPLHRETTTSSFSPTTKHNFQSSSLQTSKGFDPRNNDVMHPSVREKYIQHIQSIPSIDKNYMEYWERKANAKCAYERNYYKTSSSSHCSPNMYGFGFNGSCLTYCGSAWKVGCLISCWLRSVFGSSGLYGGGGGSREPRYDADNFPSAVDWRDIGAVSEMHAQGSCGACWGITAVETIESALFFSSGTLVDLSEMEVILCDNTCEMCYGGWPQNAYEYAHNNDGLPARGTIEYNDEILAMITLQLSGQADYFNEYTLANYFIQTCPRGGFVNGGGGGGSHSGSGSGDDYGDYDYTYAYGDTPRYGKVKGYGYSTDRCLCYSDGTGCDCDEQNEADAIINVASFGPATVCLEASTWQYYEGGIMTSESGCSAAFLDMNHCVQAVGYAFDDDEEEEEEEEEQGSGSGKSGSKDDSKRNGYWIIRNQWGQNWGMYGYAYIAMGENTCGVLNDMTQVILD